ncbi:hypothetical protein ACKWTF_015852 [Chironomus riparius]
MKIVLLISTVIVSLLAHDDYPEDCDELFDENIHPSKCCSYPSRKILDKHTEKCKKICKDSKLTSPGCCELDCIYDATGVLKNDELVHEAVVQLYENFLEGHGGGKYDKWMGIIENSVEKCGKIVKKSSDVLVCNIPEYILDFLDCIDSQNFINCPNFKYSKPCNKTRLIVQTESKCGTKVNGHFIINHKFWNTKADDDDEKISKKS